MDQKSSIFNIPKLAPTFKKLSKNDHFSPKSKAIGLLFGPKIVYSQLSPTGTYIEKAPKNDHFLPKSKAIGLLFGPKIVYFQHFQTGTYIERVSINDHFSPNCKAIGLHIWPKNRLVSTFPNWHLH